MMSRIQLSYYHSSTHLLRFRLCVFSSTATAAVEVVVEDDGGKAAFWFLLVVRSALEALESLALPPPVPPLSGLALPGDNVVPSSLLHTSPLDRPKKPVTEVLSITTMTQTTALGHYWQATSQRDYWTALFF